MIAELNQNDIDNLWLAIDKMKGMDFDAARKMELLVEAYEAQDAGDTEAEQYQEAVEALPGYSNGSDHLDHLEETASALDRANGTIQEWEDAKDDEPIDEAVKRMLAALEATTEKHAARIGKLEAALADIAAEAAGGAADALSRIRELASAALP